MRTVEAMEGELELGRVRFWKGDGEAVERGVRRAEDGEQGLEEDAALQRRGRRRRGRGVEVVVVEEVAREGDRAVRRPRAVERVQLQLMKRQRKRTRKNQFGKPHAAVRGRRDWAANLGGVRLEDELGGDAREEGHATAERPQRAAAHRQLHGRNRRRRRRLLPFRRRLLCFGWGVGRETEQEGGEVKVTWAVFAFGLSHLPIG